MAEVTITVEALVAEAQADIEKLRQTTAQLGETVEEADKPTNDFKKTWTEFNSKLQIAQQVVGSLKQAYDATAGVLIDYAAQVRDITAATGLQTEEVSKMIEVSDDAGVSVGTLKAALREMGKDGVSPSVEQLAKLSDQFKLIQDPAEKTKFLMENFGRAGLEMGKLMEQSSDSIRNASAVMDDKMAKSARDAEIAFDNLQDAVRNIQIRIGADLVPTLTDAANSMELLVSWSSRLSEAMGDHEKQVVANSSSYQDYVAEMERAYLASRDLTAGTMGALAGLKLMNAAEYDAARGYKDLADRLIDATTVTKEQTEANWTLNDSLEQQQTLIDDEIANKYRVAAATREAAQAQSVFAAGLSGPIRAEEENYNQTVKSTADKLSELRAQLSETERTTARTAEEKANLAAKETELKVAIGQTTQEIKDNADEHDAATKRILFNIVSQQVAQGNYGAEGAKVLADLAQSYGLLDEKSASFAKGVIDALETAKSSGNWAGMDQKIDALGLKAQGLGRDIKEAMSDEKVMAMNRNLAKHATAPEWDMVTKAYDGVKRKSEEAQAAQQTQTKEAQSGLATIAADPNWVAWHRQQETTQRNYDGIAYAIKSIPDHKTITITTKYVTEGTPGPVAAAAVP